MKTCNHDETYEIDCAECDKAWREAALGAGIPASVVDGKTKLRDHFSPEYIASQKNPKGSEE